MTPTADLVRDVVAAAVLKAADDGGWPEAARAAPVEIERPKERAHGDYACTIAMRLSRTLRRPPAEIAKAIAASVRTDGLVATAEATAGFVNLRLSPAWLGRQVDAIVREGDAFGRTDALRGRRVQVEYVSANPTGPMTVANARGGPIGDVLANVLAFSGADVSREYYVNDTGTQVEVFGRTLAVRYRELFGETGLEIPEGGYVADYVIDLAKRIRDEDGDRWRPLPIEDQAPLFAKKAIGWLVEQHRATTERFGIHFDAWYAETGLVASGEFADALEALRSSGHVEERDGAIWLRSRDLGEDIDSVLVRSNGIPTYFGVDVAYHREAIVKRGFDQKIDIWGANTHGHMRRMRTAMAALGLSEKWDVVIYQFVRFLHEGVLVKMGKRTGQFLLLDDVIDAVGVDAARWFFLQSSADRQLDFDFELAVQQSNENPVFYVQYAHARIASILRTAAERGLDAEGADVSLLVDDAELDLVKKLLELPELVAEIRGTKAVHRLTGYALELAGLFHGFYRDVRVVGEDVERSRARLRLVQAAQVTLRQVLGLVGVSAPESM
ncbi:MAG TPA: arginine--tRNA ligase [Candidatus Limnocylindria bacterium]|nr:arginine--tRNA ligase [Candidatus Limnocylindria bacterium]